MNISISLLEKNNSGLNTWKILSYRSRLNWFRKIHKTYNISIDPNFQTASKADYKSTKTYQITYLVYHGTRDGKASEKANLKDAKVAATMGLYQNLDK